MDVQYGLDVRNWILVNTRKQFHISKHPCISIQIMNVYECNGKNIFMR